jgi:hypothetical protein
LPIGLLNGNILVVSLDPVTRVMDGGIQAIFRQDFLKKLWSNRLI